MKKLLLACSLIAFFAVSCTQSGYLLKGHIGDTTLVDRSIFLCDAFSESVLDTTKIAQDGTFEFSGELGSGSQPFLARIAVEFSEVGTMLIVENGTINLDIDFVDGSYIPSVKGTPLNEEIALMDAKAQVSRDTLMSRISSLEKDTFLSEEEAAHKQHEFIGDYISDFKIICNDVFTRNQNNVVGLFALLNWSSIDQNINFDSLVNVSGDVIKESEAVKMQMEAIKRANATQIGKQYIDVTGVDKDGNPVSLSDYVGKGKLVLVDFWASWCEPCKAEIPNIAKIAKDYKNLVTVVGLNVWDQTEEFQKAYAEEKISWPQIIDEKQQEFAEAYAVDAIPQILLIGNDGTILARNLRGSEIEDAIKQALSR